MISSHLLLNWGIRERESARKFFPEGTYFKVNLNRWKYWAQCTCLGDSFLVVCKATRFLWSVQISNGSLAPSRICCQLRSAYLMAKAYFSHIAHPRSVGMNFFQHVYTWLPVTLVVGLQQYSPHSPITRICLHYKQCLLIGVLEYRGLSESGF